MLILNKNILTIGGNRLEGGPLTPPEPPEPPLPDIPANTVRVRTSDGNVPIKGSSTSYETATLVSGTTDVYDVYKSGTSFTRMLDSSTNITEVLGANTSNVKNMEYMFNGCTSLTSIPLFDTSNVTSMRVMFYNCTSLTSVPLFDTHNVTNMAQMFQSCSALTSVPLFVTTKVTSMQQMFYNCYKLTSVQLFDTSKVTNMNYMFAECYKVQSGALALYQQASTQTNPPTNHYNTFTNCGSNTTTGAAELAQIPSNWGGDGA